MSSLSAPSLSSGAAHGAGETEQLKARIQDQLSRLLLQLTDLEELRAELEDDEYLETKRDTLEQMEEFDAQLKKLMDGDVSLVSALGQVKLALRAAIAGAVQADDAKRAFARKEASALRTRLHTLAQGFKPRRAHVQANKSSNVRAITLVARRRSSSSTCSSARLALDSSTVRGPAP